MSEEKCSLDRAGINLRCHGGYLWELTYNECAPPGQRQNTGERCPECKRRARVRLFGSEEGQ